MCCNNCNPYGLQLLQHTGDHAHHWQIRKHTYSNRIAGPLAYACSCQSGHIENTRGHENERSRGAKEERRGREGGEQMKMKKQKKKKMMMMMLVVMVMDGW